MEDTDVLPQGTRLPLSSQTLLCFTHWNDLALSCWAPSYFQHADVLRFSGSHWPFWWEKHTRAWRTSKKPSLESAYPFPRALGSGTRLVLTRSWHHFWKYYGLYTAFQTSALSEMELTKRTMLRVGPGRGMWQRKSGLFWKFFFWGVSYFHQHYFMTFFFFFFPLNTVPHTFK